MAKKVATKGAPASYENHITYSMRQYLEVKEKLDALTKQKEELSAKIKAHVTKVNTELSYQDLQEPTLVYVVKLALSTRDSLDTKAVRSMLTPEQLQSVTKTSSVESLTVKRLEASE